MNNPIREIFLIMQRKLNKVNDPVNVGKFSVNPVMAQPVYSYSVQIDLSETNGRVKLKIEPFPF